MAEGYLKHFAGSRAEVYSAGIETHGVNPKAINIMKEDGVDISRHTSNTVDEYSAIDFDYLITVCDNAYERCPIFTSTAKKWHHNFPDPAKATGSQEEIYSEFRRVRNQIKEFCKNFIELNVNEQSS